MTLVHNHDVDPEATAMEMRLKAPLTAEAKAQVEQMTGEHRSLSFLSQLERRAVVGICSVFCALMVGCQVTVVNMSSILTIFFLASSPP